MRRALRLLALVALLAGAASFRWWAQPVLGRVAWFDADRIEVVGARLLAPHEVVVASGIEIGASVWNDPAAWEAALRRHPVVAEAEVTRRLPATLRIRIVEKRPAGFVGGGTLRPATAAGEILPVDPARVVVDLPLVAGSAPDSAARVSDRATLALLREAGRLAELDPALLARVSELRSAPGGLRLLLASPRAEVLLPTGAGEPRLTQLRAPLDDVARRAGDAGTVLLDARYADQVVVRLPQARPVPPVS